jgi:beta-galactosidase
MEVWIMEYKLNINNLSKEIRKSSLKMGGQSPKGDTIGFTNYYMEWNHEPIIGICGEFHYSRYPESEWKQELLKMKACGIGIIASYIFWNHHEEEEGIFRWDGNRDLRRFVQLCAEAELQVMIRVGPFCHGEVRNGGMPDWLYGRSFEVRSNDLPYLEYVRRLYGEIGRQVQGLFFQDGGPIIGIQLENEFMHASAIWECTSKQGDHDVNVGSGGKEHMRLLKEIAMEMGLVAPIYTSTGWGGAPVLEDEVLPLYGGYAYTPWNVNVNNLAQKPTGEYIFQHFHSNLCENQLYAMPYPPERYPFACCEMGGGMQNWYLSRFVVEPESVSAMTMMKLAGGCNFVGYYMFHGGTNPVGVTGFLNESTTPKIGYDFQAPLGEFGQVRASARQLLPVLSFLKHFGARLAPMASVLPAGADRIEPSDSEILRYAARAGDGAGFLFINNYQDHVEMKDHEGVQFSIELDQEELCFPTLGSITVRKNVSAIMPLHFDMDGVLLKYATAMPVTRLCSGRAATYFFRMNAGMDGEFCLWGDDVAHVECDAGRVIEDSGVYTVRIGSEASAMIVIRRDGGEKLRIYVMSWEESLHMWEAPFHGKHRVFLSKSALTVDRDELVWYSEGEENVTFRMYPGDELELQSQDGVVERTQEGWFTAYTVNSKAVVPQFEVVRTYPHKATLRMNKDILEGVKDVIYKIDYTGDIGGAYVRGKLLHDHFYNGVPWEMGIRRFFEASRERLEVDLHITPLKKGSTIAVQSGMAAQQVFTGQQIAELHSVEAVPVYQVRVGGSIRTNR